MLEMVTDDLACDCEAISCDSNMYSFRHVASQHMAVTGNFTEQVTGISRCMSASSHLAELASLDTHVVQLFATVALKVQG